MQFPFAQGFTFIARRWRNLMNVELRELGQRRVRWGTLYWIAVFGDNVNQSELGERIGVSQRTLERVLNGLERDGLIQRRAADRDKRAKVARLTKAAAPVMRKIARIQDIVRARLLAGIDAHELKVCVSVFARILANLDRR
jgi:MarR family transcriptional regulator, transcriptional regulator for hemolysin